jgi:hypothetical protein
MFGVTLDVAEYARYGALDIACGGYYILYVDLVVARRLGC